MKLGVSLLCACILFSTVIVIGEEIKKVSVDASAGTFVGYVYDYEALGQPGSSRRFLGVPYAKEPVGERRFKKPERLAPLQQPWDATKHGPVCIQQQIALGGERNPHIGDKLQVSEDCLFLNIYTPNEPDTANEKLPVMIYFHGGGFVIGAPHLYVGDVLASYGKVIFVTVGYRLSIWGFLSTGDENLPGNYGLWDQHMAIHWVHDNIAAFGGDPSSITLIGTSAGGASVIYQSQFPGNKGVVKRGVAHSGSVTCPWAFNPDPLAATKKLAQLVGCDVMESTNNIAQCLKSKSTEELDRVLNDKNNEFVRFPMEFLPTLDHDFLPESPNSLFHGSSTKAKEYQASLASIDLMTGVVSEEGLMMTIPFAAVEDADSFEVDRVRLENELVPWVLRIVFGDDVPATLRSLVLNEYTDWNDPDNSFNSRESYLKLSSDYVFNIQMIETALLHTKLSDRSTFVYHYDAFPSKHLCAIPSWSTNNKSQHCDEMTTLLGYDNNDGFLQYCTPYNDDPPEAWELELSKSQITMWTNFARSGDPNTPTDVKSFINTVWPKYDAESQRYLNITRQMSADSVGSRLFSRAVNFWYQLLPEVRDAVRMRPGMGDKDYCERDGDCDP